MDGVLGCAWSSDGTRILSSGASGLILWDAATGRRLRHHWFADGEHAVWDDTASRLIEASAGAWRWLRRPARRRIWRSIPLPWRPELQWAIMTIMSKMARKAGATAEQVNVAMAKNRLSELLGRVAYGGETVLITRRGRPMARLVPPDFVERGHGLADVKGWMDDDHPFLTAVRDIVAARQRHLPRALKRPSRGR